MKERKIGNIQKLSPGKYKIRISAGFDDFGKRRVINRTVNAKSDTEAERILMKLYQDRFKITAAENSPGTLGKLFDIFKENHLNTLAPNTQAYYFSLWKHIEKFSKLKTENIDVININKILSAVPEGKLRNGCYKLLSTLFTKGMTWGYIAANPCKLISAPKYKSKEKVVLNDSDIFIINNHIEEVEIKYQCIFYFAALLGMRRQEILALKWNDINFKEATVLINKAVTLSHGGDERIILKETKTESSARVLYLPELLIRKLQLLKKEQNILRMKLGDLYENNNFLFTQWNGKVMSIYTPTNWWKDFQNKHNITPVTFHGLRHSAASMMINAGLDVATVSKTLGHSNTATTLNIYTHLIEDTKKQAVLSVANKFSSSK